MYSYTIHMYLLLFLILSCHASGSRKRQHARYYSGAQVQGSWRRTDTRRTPPEQDARYYSGAQVQGSWRRTDTRRTPPEQGHGNDFYSEVIATWTLVKEAFGIQWCFNGAKKRINKVPSYDYDDYGAKVSIGMYSRYCKIKKLITEDENILNFPMRLNKELRCEGVDVRPVRNVRVKQLFQQVGNLMNKALDKLRPILFSENFLYRGVTTFPFQAETHFIEFGFFSASKSIDVAIGFAKGNILFIVEEMFGVYIADLAEEQFAYQEEVLAKSNTMFSINKRVKKKDTIIKTIRSLKSTRSVKNYPKIILYISEYVNPSPDVLQRVSRHQQYMSQDFCKPSLRA